MKTQSPMTVKCNANGTLLEFCFGEIPDTFRKSNFKPLCELKLPNKKVTDEQFEGWLHLYRYSNNWFQMVLLEESQCS